MKQMIRIRIDKHCSVLIGLALLLVMPAGAHVGDRVYPIAYLTDEMVAQIQLDDGSVGEWYELIGEPALTLLDFRSLMGSSPDPADLDFRIWLAWHDDPARFYLAFAASDDMYQNTHEYYSGNDWMKFHDSIQFSFDGDHSGGAGCCCPCKDSGRVFEALEQTQVYQSLARTDSGPTLDDFTIRYATGRFAWTVLPPYGDGGGRAGGGNPTVSVIEIYVTPFDRFGRTNDIPVPEGSVTSDLAANQVIGFAIQVVDHDGDHDSSYWIPEPLGYDFPQAVQFAQADFYLDGILLPPDPEGTAVESVSWGRIKAALDSGWGTEEIP